MSCAETVNETKIPEYRVYKIPTVSTSSCYTHKVWVWSRASSPHTAGVCLFCETHCWELPAIYQTTNFSSGKIRRLLVSAGWSNNPNSEFKQRTFCKNYFWRSHLLVKSVVSHVWPYHHVAFSLWIFKRYVQKYLKTHEVTQNTDACL
jgi:hypothetical protein